MTATVTSGPPGPPMPDGDRHFRATLAPGRRGAAVMSLEGEFDLAAYEPFMQCLARAVAEDRPLEVDMARVRYMDSTGLRGLLQARNLLGEERLLIVDPSEKVATLLAMSGTRHLFRVEGPPAP